MKAKMRRGRLWGHVEIERILALADLGQPFLGLRARRVIVGYTVLQWAATVDEAVRGW